MNSIYVVEDDDNIRELLRCALESEGYSVDCFENAISMLNVVEHNLPQLILMDVMMPKITGIEALQLLKKQTITKNIPIILLTAKSEEIDKVKGLDLGAEDYITKPFGVSELLARIRVAIRRLPTTITSNLIIVQDITINLKNHTVHQGEKLIELTTKEFQLLKILMDNVNTAILREDIIKSVWGYDYIGETRTLDMHIKTLRNKLSDTPEKQKYIKTIRTVGYMFLQ